MVLDNTQDGLIFVWGQVGKRLQKLDTDRLIAIAQNDSDYHLTIIYNSEIENLIDDIHENGLTDELKKSILESNKKHNIFKEVHDYFKQSSDNLSVGSLLTGELDKSERFARIRRITEGENND